MNVSRRVAVIGAGISGLAAAHRLNELNAGEIVVFEASLRAGGIIATERRDGFLLEKGPDAFLSEKPAAIELCRRLGIENELIGTRPECRKSRVARGGRLIAVPQGFYLIAPVRVGPFLKSPLFSPLGKLRMLAEPLVPRRAGAGDESVAEFVARRFGREALERAGQPLIGGIYTGDPARLSLESTLPRLAALEREFGSVTKGLRREKASAHEASGPRYSLFVSFKKGMETLIDALMRALNVGASAIKAPADRHGSIRLQLNCKIAEIFQENEKWRLTTSDGREEFFDDVLITLDAKRASQLLEKNFTPLADQLRKISYESVATVNLAYPEAAIPEPLDSFGFVVPQTEKSAIVACSFSHLKFPGRAPAGKALLRAFVGGAFGRAHFGKSDDAVIADTRRELRRYLGIEAEPLFASLTRYPDAMVQYGVGHAALCRSIEAEAAKFPGLHLAGAAYRGVGIPDCIADAERQAEKIHHRSQP